ncbi:hypothetical protein M885DRAFT_626583 [Pelagophyceae sp. CCMP2097]|nr:hypothetical protein M885DRAFT_626583 [Pelagophyceae sp. CCMP2097]
MDAPRASEPSCSDLDVYRAAEPPDESTPMASSDAYMTTLETTMKTQQAELEKLRRNVDAEYRARVGAERRAEQTKTELINARLQFALDLAEQKCAVVEVIEAKVAERSSSLVEDLRSSLSASEAARRACEGAARSVSVRLDEEVVGHATVARAAATRGWLAAIFGLVCVCIAGGGAVALRGHEARDARLREKLRGARASARGLGAEARAARLAAAVSAAAHARARRATAICERAGAEASARRFEHDDACAAAVQGVRTTAAAVLDGAFICVAIKNVAHVADAAARAAQQCAAPAQPLLELRQGPADAADALDATRD